MVVCAGYRIKCNKLFIKKKKKQNNSISSNNNVFLLCWPNINLLHIFIWLRLIDKTQPYTHIETLSHTIDFPIELFHDNLHIIYEALFQNQINFLLYLLLLLLINIINLTSGIEKKIIKKIIIEQFRYEMKTVCWNLIRLTCTLSRKWCFYFLIIAH